MRKFLLLFLITFSAPSIASYVKQIELCNDESTTFYSKCPVGHSCYKIPKNHKCETHSIVDEIIDGDPIYSENEIEVCDSMESCNVILIEKVCSDPDEYPEIRENLTEVFCSKFLYFEQVPSGKKVIRLDSVKKAVYDAEKQAEKDAVKTEKDAVKVIKQGLKGAGEVSNDDIKEALKYLLKAIK